MPFPEKNQDLEEHFSPSKLRNCEVFKILFMKSGFTSRLKGNPFSHSWYFAVGVLRTWQCLHLQWNTWKACTGGRCRRTLWANNGSGLDMRRAIEVSQGQEKKNSLQLISKKQVLSRARPEVEFTQHVLAVHDYNEIIWPGQTTKGKWVTSGIWERELKGIEYFRSSWLL